MSFFISLFVIFLLFNYFIIALGSEVDLTKFIDSFHGFNFSYPYEWKIQYQNNGDIFFFPLVNTKYNNNTFIEIESYPLSNLSLKDHVFRDLNYYINKYIIGNFLSFKVTNIECNLTINESPAYKTEYHVIMNDTNQSPVIIIEYYIIDQNDSLYKLKFREDGYITNLFNENATKFIINSFSFNSSKPIH